MRMEVLDLGKLLVKELGLKSTTDTLSRWMAHYIAEQMIEIETSAGPNKKAAEEECVKTILNLWDHIESFPAEVKPFARFEPIYKILEKLDPDKTDGFYFQQHNTENDNPNGMDNADEVNEYLMMASDIDEIVRIWLNYILQKAAEHATDDKTKEWIKASAPFAYNKETSLIARLLDFRYIDESVVDSKEEKKIAIQHRLEQLNSYSEFNNKLIDMYKEDLAKLE